MANGSVKVGHHKSLLVSLNVWSKRTSSPQNLSSEISHILWAYMNRDPQSPHEDGEWHFLSLYPNADPLHRSENFLEATTQPGPSSLSNFQSLVLRSWPHLNSKNGCPFSVSLHVGIDPHYKKPITPPLQTQTHQVYMFWFNKPIFKTQFFQGCH